MISKIQLTRNDNGLPGRLEKQHPAEPDMFLSLLPQGNMSSGNSRSTENRQKLFSAMGISPRRIYSLRQVHSRKVLISGKQTRRGIEGDGLVNGNADHILAVSVADCMPIYLFHRGAGRFALLHSGWKGTGIVAEAVKLFHGSFGLALSELTAVLGPSIRSCCYRVDDERAELFQQRWGEGSVKDRTDSFGRRIHFIDLVEANIGILDDLGVGDIRVVEECTACGADLGSFRREGPGEFTHMLAMIGFFN